MEKLPGLGSKTLYSLSHLNPENKEAFINRFQRIQMDEMLDKEFKNNYKIFQLKTYGNKVNS